MLSFKFSVRTKLGIDASLNVASLSRNSRKRFTMEQWTTISKIKTDAYFF